MEHTNSHSFGDEKLTLSDQRSRPTSGQFRSIATSLSQVRTLVVSDRPTYHVFEYRGYYVLYDLGSSSLLTIDFPTFMLLSHIAGASSDDEIARRLDALGIASHVSEICQEVLALHEIGLFQSEPEEAPEDRTALIESYLSHSPRKVMLLVQSSCNFKCTYCYEVQSGFHHTATKSMDWETATASVHSLVERSGDRRELEITFFGGEPLLNFQLIQRVVTYCETLASQYDKSFSYSITTNGSLLDDEIISYLVDKQFAVMISIDGPPELSDRARMDLGGNPVGSKTQSKVEKLIEAQRARGIREAMIRATMSHENHDTIAIESYFRDQGYRRTMIGASTGRVNGKTPHDLQSEDIEHVQATHDSMIDEYLAWTRGELHGEPSQSLIRGLKHIEEQLRSRPSGARMGCGVGRNMLAYTPGGKIYPCHRYAGETAYELGTVAAGIDQNRLRRLYEETLRVYDDHCSKCWARVICGGQCAHYQSGPDGHVLPPPAESCDALRVGFEKSLWLLSQSTKRDSSDRKAHGETAEGASI